MSRHAFWTIIVGGSPTAFRAPLPEDLQPTLVQLQRRHPDAVLRWFEKGQLWETPGHAQDAARARREADRPHRGPSWRPGGEHKDPRDKYKQPRDVKRRKWASQAAEGRGPWVKKEGRNEGAKEPRNEGGKDGRKAGSPRPEWRKPAGDRPRPDRRPAGSDTRTPAADRRPRASSSSRPSSARPPSARPPSARPPSARPPSARPPSAGRPPSGRPPRPPSASTAPAPPAAAPKRKPKVYKAGEMPPKRKTREEE